MGRVMVRSDLQVAVTVGSEFQILISIRETPFKEGTLLHRTCGLLKKDLIERVYIPKGPLNPISPTRQRGRSEIRYVNC